jgi:hypothetical protein
MINYHSIYAHAFSFGTAWGVTITKSCVEKCFNVWFLTYFPTTVPPLQHLDHTLGPAHYRPFPALFYELHCRQNLSAHAPGQELSFSQFFYSLVCVVSHYFVSVKSVKKNGYPFSNFSIS